MEIKISQRVWDASGHSQANINGTLDWILGYLAPENRNMMLMKYIREDTVKNTITITIDNATKEQIEKRFGDCNNEMISSILAVAYALGGQE